MKFIFMVACAHNFGFHCVCLVTIIVRTYRESKSINALKSIIESSTINKIDIPNRDKKRIINNKVTSIILFIVVAP